jgi:hypothetical protein
MSRSGYSDDCEGWEMICWRGAVASAIRGRRGQTLLGQLAQALDAMPEKRLIEGEFQTREGDVCALGALAKFRGLDATGINPENRSAVASTFDIAEALAAEIMYVNDDWNWHETPEQRWQTVRKWVGEKLRV